jgi:DNA-binding NarL/FixJ family response regulator
MIRIVLADDQPLVRAGFAAILNAQADLEVVGQAATGREAIDLVRAQRPDVVLMDIRMPELDGLEATKRIVGDPDLDAVRIIILTTFEVDEYVFNAIRNGASGFLVKHCEPAELTRAVRVTAAGEAMLSPGVTQRLLAEYARRAQEPPSEASRAVLTDREREIVALVGQGLENDEIAQQLYLSVATVRTHVGRAMMKLGTRNRAHLVIFAYESGLVRPGWSP